MPNTGPIEGSRSARSTSLPIFPRPWVSEIDGVVLPPPRAFSGPALPAPLRGVRPDGPREDIPPYPVAQIGVATSPSGTVGPVRMAPSDRQEVPCRRSWTRSGVVDRGRCDTPADGHPIVPSSVRAVRRAGRGRAGRGHPPHAHRVPPQGACRAPAGGLAGGAPP